LRVPTRADLLDVPDVLRPWSAQEPLSQLTLHADWDSVASMVESLRIHAFQWGTVPTWNFMFCGGRPELAVPFSWAWTWPSLFAYLLSPLPALLAVWALMTGVGLFAVGALLLRWTGSPLGAGVGAAVYVFSGYFAAHFNAGHPTFAFYHLVPAAMLCFEWGYAGALAGRRTVGASAAGAVVAFLFFTAGLPHALIHFYPALLLLVAVRLAFAGRQWGWRAALLAARAPLGAQVLGLWWAAYKLWPVMRWQLGSPRGDLVLEAYGPLQVLGNTLRFVPHYFAAETWLPWFVLPAWGYNAFVGPAPWLLAGVAVVTLLRSRGTAGAKPDRGSMAFALLLVGAGLLLALGNDSPWSPARGFRYLPLLGGVRAFNRYQILLVFGLAILAAHGVAWITGRVAAKRFGRALLGLVVLATVVPVLAQSALLVWNIAAQPRHGLLAAYPVSTRPEPPELMGTYHSWHALSGGTGHQWSVLERGYWIANCYANLSMPRLRRTPLITSSVPLSNPPPDRVVGLTRDTLTLAYAPGGARRVALNLPVLPTFRFNAPAETMPSGHVAFRTRDLPENRLSVTAAYSGPQAGAWTSLTGLLAGLAVAGRAWRRRRVDAARPLARPTGPAE